MNVPFTAPPSARPMAVAMRGVDVPHWIAVHSLDDMASGLYRWARPDDLVTLLFTCVASRSTRRGPVAVLATRLRSATWYRASPTNSGWIRRRRGLPPRRPGS